MEIDDDRLRDLVKCYKQHIELDINYHKCSIPEHECDLNQFFLEVEERLEGNEVKSVKKTEGSLFDLKKKLLEKKIEKIDAEISQMKSYEKSMLLSNSMIHRRIYRLIPH